MIILSFTASIDAFSESPITFMLNGTFTSFPSPDIVRLSLVGIQKHFDGNTVTVSVILKASPMISGGTNLGDSMRKSACVTSFDFKSTCSAFLSPKCTCLSNKYAFSFSGNDAINLIAK